MIFILDFTSIGRKVQTDNSVDISSSAQLRAEIFQTTLSSEFPNFLKCMLPSHVTGGFWLSFPKRFCISHLPKHDANVVLVDEDGDEFSTKYLIGKSGLSGGWRGFSIAHNLKSGLSGGWRGFSIAHNLVENDVVVFQLIETCKFKSFPKRFCISHLPKHDANVVLVDEDGDEFSTKYLIGKCGLSGGWRGFSIAHNLVENDVVVFQLIETCKFKVYILRENCLSHIDVAVVLMDFIVEAHNEDPNEKMNMCESNDDKYLEPPKES
uniref:DNA binding protein n=1 Tax=Solanum tuberosum TaxID=4113 RepID=M1DBS4_SOLTU